MNQKKKFDIDYWLNKKKTEKEPTKKPQQQTVQNVQRNDIEIPDLSDVEVIIKRLEEAHIDITANYSDWRDIGFAFANEFAESGRDYFHRVSRYYSDYSYSVCDKQYNNCLKAKGHGVTIKTFFHLAQQAGISLITTSPKKIQSQPKKSTSNSKTSTEDKTINEVIFNTPQI